MSTYIPALLGLLGVLLSSVITFVITHRKLKKDYKNSLDKDWLKEFKECLSGLCEKASLFHHGENVVPFGREKHSEYMQAANAYRYKLQLILDPQCKYEEEVLEAIEIVISAMFEGNAVTKEGSLLHKSIQSLIVKSRVLLRIKHERG